MIDTLSYPNFFSDGSNKISSIYPVIIIGWDTDNNTPLADAINISTVGESIKINGSRKSFLDADLKVSSIKESIDFESRKFKISNVTITFSNYGKLADALSKINIMNREVAVFYKSSSCKDIDECLPVYFANVRRHDQTSKNIKIQLEDNTQEKISKDIPIANVGTDITTGCFSEKYLNRYIPITYGVHRYAPAIAWPRDDHATDFYVICDDVFGDRYIGSNIKDSNACYAKKGEYWRITENADHSYGGDGPNVLSFTDVTQYYKGSSTTGPWNWVYFESKFNGSLPENMVAANEFQATFDWYPNQVELVAQDGKSIHGNSNSNWNWNAEGSQPDTQVHDQIELSAPENVLDDPWDTNVFGELGVETFSRVPNNDINTIAEVAGIPECQFAHGYDFSGTRFGNNYEPFKFIPRIINDCHLKKIKWGDDLSNYVDVANKELITLNDIYNDSYLDMSRPQAAFNEDYGSSSWMWHWEQVATEVSDSHIDNQWYRYSSQWSKWPRKHHVKHLYAADEINTISIDQDSNPTRVDGGLAYVQIPSGKKIMDRIKSLLEDGEISVSGLSAGDNLNWYGNTTEGYYAANCLMSGEDMDYDSGGQSKHYTGADLGYGNIYRTHRRAYVNGNDGEYVYGAANPWGDMLGNWTNTNEPYGEYWYCPKVESATPHGNIFWLFGYYDEGEPDTDTGEPFGDYGDANNHDNDGNEYAHKYIAVTFDKDVASINSSQDSRIKATFSLYELFNFSKLPIVIPYNYVSGGMDRWTYTDTQVDYIKTINPTFDCYWNGVSFNNYDNDSPIVGTDGCQDAATPGDDRYGFFGGINYKTVDPIDFQQSLTSGEDRWFTVNLQSWKGYPAGTILTNLATDHQGFAGSEYKWVGWSGGSIQTTSTEDYMSLKSPEEAGGLVCGLRFSLPDLDIEDNIDGYFKTYWKRKLSIGIDEENTVLNITDNALKMYAYANNSLNRDDDSIVEKSRTDPNENDTNWTYEYLINRLSSGNEPHVMLDNVEYAENSFGLQGDTSGEHGGSSKFDGDSSEYYDWLYPDQFGNFTVMFEPEKVSSSATAAPILMNIKIYRTYIYVVADFENLYDTDFYLRTHGRFDNSYNTIENPATIIKDLLKNELEFKDTVSVSSLQEAESSHSGWDFAFSVTDKINSKKLIEDFSKSTKFFPNFKGQKEFSFTNIHNSYSIDNDYNMLIDPNDIISYSYSRTKMEDVKSKVSIKYNWDYGNSKFLKNTGWTSAKDFLGDGDLGYTNSDGDLGYSLNYFNITEEDTVLNFESKYIQRQRPTANRLAEFLVMWYCNQHTIIKFKSRNFNHAFLQVGDIIRFSDLLEGKTIYGEDYTNNVVRNGQRIFGLFLITSTEKSSNSIGITCIQLHDLGRKFTAELGDIDRDGIVEENGNDYNLLIEYVDKSIDRARFTRHQIVSMDINESKSVNQRDVDYWPEWWPYYWGSVV